MALMTTQIVLRNNKDCLCQHSLMNIQFTNLNDIIHPKAGIIPEYMHRFASAMFTNNKYWNNPVKVKHDLEMKCYRADYINTYLSYINMMKSSYNLYSKGFMIWEDFRLFWLSDSFLQSPICKTLFLQWLRRIPTSAFFAGLWFGFSTVETTCST